MKYKQRHIYIDKNNNLRLVLGVTDITVNFVYLYPTNIYEDIYGAHISAIPGYYYACIDRATYNYISDMDKLCLEDIGELSINEYMRIINIITQYFTGEILMYQDSMMYREEYNKLSKYRNTLIMKRVKHEISDDDIKEQDHIGIEEALYETRSSNIIKFSKNGEEYEYTNEGDNYDRCVNVAPSECDIEDLKAMLYRAKENNISIDIDETKEGLASIGFNPFGYTMPKGTVTGIKPSKPRKGVKDTAKHIRNTTRYMIFNYFQVIEIANMSSARQVADKYRVDASDAGIIYNKFKIIVGIKTPVNKENKFAYTKYFNIGYSIDDVYNVYNGTIAKSEIASNYKAWIVNSYGHNNEVVTHRWEEIFNQINSEDAAVKNKARDILIDTYFDNTYLDFAKKEKCSQSCASDIMNNIRNIIYRNAFVAAGFEKLSFDKDALIEFASDCINSDTMADRVKGNLYEMANKLYKLYEKTYDDHSSILTKGGKIPSELKEADDIDCFKSLLWNRFNHKYMTVNRELSNNQINALESGIIARIALLFMVDYNTAYSIKNSYNKIKAQKEVDKIVDSIN